MLLMVVTICLCFAIGIIIGAEVWSDAKEADKSYFQMLRMASETESGHEIEQKPKTEKTKKKK